MHPETRPSPTPRSKWRTRFGWFGAFLLLLAALTLSFSPATPPMAPPTAIHVRDARAVFHRVRGVAGRSDPKPIAVSWAEARGIALLIGHAAKVERIAIDQDGDALRATASIPLRWGPWINLDARITPSDPGFPDIALKVGRLPIPAFVTRSAIWVARSVLRWRGAKVPHADDVVRSLTVAPSGIVAALVIPKDTQLFKSFNQAQFAPVDTKAAAEAYCALARVQRADPDKRLAVQLRRAFAHRPTAATPEDQNRSALIAVAMLTGSGQIGKIAGDVSSQTQDCKIPPQALTLLGRADLGSHWSISAALASIFGPDLSQAMGTWKEVSDSGASGSGFSFIDLAADRSGIHTAGRALNPDTAAALAIEIQGASDERLLPVKALALSEGLSEQAFTKRYISTESAQYGQMIIRIDRVLSRQGH